MEWDDLLNKLSSNLFKPTDDSLTELPHIPGVVVICTKNIDVLPKSMSGLKYSYINGLPVIYTGITSNIYSRTNDHFNGTTQRSTLRKSFGALFAFERLYVGEKNKFSFTPENEAELSRWMKNNLVMYYALVDNPEYFKTHMINYFEPPLNLAGNNGEKNRPFREELSIRINK